MNIELMFKKRLLEVKRELSDGTYRHDLNHSMHFLNWCNTNNIIESENLTEEKLVDYIAFQKRTCTARTINKRIGVIKRTFIHNNVRFEYLEELKKLKESTPVTAILDDKIFFDLRKNYIPNMPEATELELLRKTLLVLLVNTGARINEIRHIEKKNIDLKNFKILLTTTKTKSHRYAYLTPGAIETIEKMIDTSKSKYLLFDSTKNDIITYEFARYSLINIEEHYGLQRLTTHMFRHTIGAFMHDQEVSDLILQEILGHKDLATTKIYSHVRAEKVQEVYLKKMKKLD